MVGTPMCGIVFDAPKGVSLGDTFIRVRSYELGFYPDLVQRIGTEKSPMDILDSSSSRTVPDVFLVDLLLFELCTANSTLI